MRRSPEIAVQLLRKHSSEPVPLDPVPEPLRPLVAAGMAKDPRRRPADAAGFVTGLQEVAAGAYGRDWADRGRSQLGEAALLLAALWPSAAAPAVQGTGVYRSPGCCGDSSRRVSPLKAVIAAGLTIAVIAGRRGSRKTVALAAHRGAPRSRPAGAGDAQPVPACRETSFS